MSLTASNFPASLRDVKTSVSGLPAVQCKPLARYLPTYLPMYVCTYLDSGPMVVAVYGAAKQKTAFVRDLLIHSRRIATRHPPTIHLPLRWMDMDAPVVDICIVGKGSSRAG